MTQHFSRRNFLRVGVASPVPLLGGCSLFRSRGIVLGPILVRNAHPNPHSVRVELFRDGELLLEETVSVAPQEVERLEATWTSTPEKYRLRYAVHGPDVEFDIQERTITAADRYDADQKCAIPAITLLPNDSPYVIVLNAARTNQTCPTTDTRE